MAYPLARRAYESLSLMVACYISAELASSWQAGKKVSNAKVRKVLAEHPFGETEESTKQAYRFFSQAAHPNRDLVAHRFLGEGNQFVLGSIGQPDLVLLADYCMRTLALWFWFGAFIRFVFLQDIARHDKNYSKDYQQIAKSAQDANEWLAEQYNRVLSQSQAEQEIKS